MVTTLPGLSDVDVSGMVSGASNSMAQLKSMLPYALIGILIGVGLFYMLRMRQHRINVELFETIKDGYVISTYRYAIAYDKGIGLEYLRPMFGKERLPPFPTEYFNKVITGNPFGVNREISLVRYNKYSYKVILPAMDERGFVEVYSSPIKRWLFMEEKRKFIAKQKKADFMAWLSIIAPLAVIVGCFVFFSIITILYIQDNHQVANKIDLMTKILVSKLEAV